MKIAFLVPMLPPYRITFYDKLNKIEGVEVKVFCGTQSGETGRPSFEGNVDFPASYHKKLSKSLLGISCDTYVGMAKKLKEFLPDIVIFPDHCSCLTYWRVLWWARERHVEVIIWSCGWEKDSVKRLARIAKRIILSKFIGYSNYIIAYSSKAKAKMVSLGYSEHLVDIAYNGIEIDDIQQKYNELLYESRSIEKCNKTVFLYVGGMIPDKKIDLLLRAYAERETSDTELWLIGDGPTKQRLELMASSLAITNIKFWGRIIGGVDKYFAAADYFVLPGAGGLAINQAMFWEIPCIVSIADGTEEDLVYHNKTGFRFKFDSKDSLVSAMNKALGLSNSKRIAMGREAKRIVVERSNVNMMVETFYEVCKKLLTANKI